MNRSKDLDTVAPDDLIVKAAVKPKITSNPLPKISQEPTKPELKSKLIPRDFSEVQQVVYDIFGHTKSPFSSSLVHPKVFDFQERNQDEQILLVLRQHWFSNVSWIITAIFMLFLPFLFNFIPSFNGFFGNLQFILSLSWYLMTFAFAFEKFLSWYFDVYIITDERVVDIDFNNLINKHYSEAELSVIQDVTSKVIGLSQTIFNYGTIYIQTAAEVPEIQFEKVPNPEKVIKVLQQLRQEEKKEDLDGRNN